MKHPSIRELFEYWNARRGGRPAPERAEIEPAAIRRVLADTFILSFDPAAGHPFRIAGTRVCALFNRELKGEAFLDLWSMESRRDIRDLLMIVADESVGVAASASGMRAAQAGPRSLRTPNDRVRLGALAPSEPPAWLGTSPLAGLTLGTHRYVAPAASAPPPLTIAPKAHFGLSGGRIRHGFVVYDGGQS